MEKFTNNSYLSEKNVSEKYLFFYQIWKELTNNKTIDSLQYRSMNTLNILKEVVEIIDEIDKGYTCGFHNLEECKREALSIIKKNKTLKTMYPLTYNRLLSNLSTKIEKDNQKNVLRRQIAYNYNEIRETYLDNLINTLETEIHNTECSSYKEIQALTQEIISVCVSEGWSEKALNRTVDNLFESNIKPQKWAQFRNKINIQNKSTYHVIIPIEIQVKSTSIDLFEELASFGFHIKTKEAILNDYSINNIKKIPSYIVIVQEAFDYYSASNLALNKYSYALSTMGFFNVIESRTLDRISWYVINIETNTCRLLRIKDIYGTYNTIEGAHSLYLKTKNLMGVPELCGLNDLQIRLKSTFSYANIGKASYTQEDKFINMWVALESLCRSDAYDSIISNVLETIPAALCHRYIYKLVRNYCEDCIRCQIDLKFSTVDLTNSVHTIQKVKKVIEILKNDLLYKELKEKCKINKLLLFRTEQMHELFVDKQNLFISINRHYANVRMQLVRLYRLRNRIAHSASFFNGSLIHYIEHLESYLDELVAEVVMCSTKIEETEVATILEIIRENYRAFCEITSAKKSMGQDSLLTDFYNTGMISMVF